MSKPSGATVSQSEAGVDEAAPRARRAVTTVLVVDDYPAMLRGIPKVLESDATVTVVGTAARIADAITLAHQLQPDVAVIDVNIPGGGGWALARRLRQTAPGIRLVAYSVYADDALIDRTLEAEGVNAFVLKGSDSELLMAAIHGANVTPSHKVPTPLLGRVRQFQTGAEPVR